MVQTYLWFQVQKTGLHSLDSSDFVGNNDLKLFRFCSAEGLAAYYVSRLQTKKLLKAIVPNVTETSGQSYHFSNQHDILRTCTYRDLSR